VQILANIGEDLLIAAADQPFRFPATFTFVVRSFTVLDGIGKSLSPRFDISEIAAPYARELLLEGRPYLTKFKEDFSKRWFRQVRLSSACAESTYLMKPLVFSTWVTAEFSL
jgi:predicted unusual protein kinase regulating ubiquinone biosynthesis (AarF/ABC1/UbiB family)